MICPVELARDMSALRAGRIGDHAEHGSLSEGRDGAGDESTGRGVAGDGEEDHMVAGGGGSGYRTPAHAAGSGGLRCRGSQRIAGPAAGQALASAGAGGDGGESVRAVPGEIFRSERAAFSREVAVRARDRTELHLGEAGAAGSRPGDARTQARGASQAAGAAAVAGDAVAYRRQPASVVSGRTLVRPDRDSGRRHQRDLLRPTGGGGIDGDGDGRTEGSDRPQGRVLRAVRRSGKPFLADSEGGWQGGLPSADAGGAGVTRVGSADDRGLLAGSARAERAQLWYLAGALAARVAAAPVGGAGGGDPVSAGPVHRRVQSPFSGRTPTAGPCFCALPES